MERGWEQAAEEISGIKKQEVTKGWRSLHRPRGASKFLLFSQHKRDEIRENNSDRLCSIHRRK
jgi:hypothetical protein